MRAENLNAIHTPRPAARPQPRGMIDVMPGRWQSETKAA